MFLNLLPFMKRKCRACSRWSRLTLIKENCRKTNSSFDTGILKNQSARFSLNARDLPFLTMKGVA